MAKEKYTGSGYTTFSKGTYYVYEASGKVLATYEKENGITKLREVPLLGSLRLGMDRVDVIRSNTPLAITSVYSRTVGSKNYELTDHLGNVRAVVGDIKLPSGASFMADLRSSSDYYPFGMALPARGYQSADYRYGYNGKEKDDEVKGDGVQYDYGFRIYDSRLARFLSVDPLTKNYPMLTPYQFASNTPIQAIDLDGLEGFQYLETMKMKDGTTLTKRVVELDIHVATSKDPNSMHYKSSDIGTIHSDLTKEYNKGFRDAQGNVVEFRFNMKEFDADQTNPRDMAKGFLRDENDKILSINGMVYANRSIVMERTKIEQTNPDGYIGGETLNNHVSIDIKSDILHTKAHEVAHTFLIYDGASKNPFSRAEHDEAGGIFKYQVVDITGKVITPKEPLNQDNVDCILSVVPETAPVTKVQTDPVSKP